MADLKISQLTGGGASQAADEYIINRGGSNFKVTGANLGKGLDAIVCSGQSLTGTQNTSLADLAATWNTTGTPTAIKLNVTDTASNAASNLLDLQVGGASRVRVSKGGNIVAAGVVQADTVAYNVASFKFTSTSESGLSYWAAQQNISFLRAGVVGLTWNGSVHYIGSNDAFGIANATQPVSGGPDVLWYRDAAGTFAQRNSTNAQTLRVYRSFTDASNYSRLSTGWSSTTALIATEGAGTGSRGNIAFGSAALATNATVGYVMIPSCAGAPTGVPADIPTGQVALHYDTTNNKLYVYNGSWRSTAALT